MQLAKHLYQVDGRDVSHNEYNSGKRKFRTFYRFWMTSVDTCPNTKKSEKYYKKCHKRLYTLRTIELVITVCARYFDIGRHLSLNF